MESVVSIVKFALFPCLEVLKNAEVNEAAFRGFDLFL